MEFHKSPADADADCDDEASAKLMVNHQHVDPVNPSSGRSTPIHNSFTEVEVVRLEDRVTLEAHNMEHLVEAYRKKRSSVLQGEKARDFDFECRVEATPIEIQVDSILHKLRKEDEKMFEEEKPRKGNGGQEHPRFAGDHYLSNVDLIQKSNLFRVARHLPKGSHLHIHFNACLPPRFLLDIAAGMDRMFITGNVPLTPENLDRCQIEFSIKSKDDENDEPAPINMFPSDHKGRWCMKFGTFLTLSENHFDGLKPMDWVVKKVEFQEEEAYGPLQTAAGAWKLFNGRTKLMKGLFNYEKAFRKYVGAFLQNLVDDKILYAEIRPTFMESNYLFSDDGTGKKNNAEIMDIIIEEVDKFKAGLSDKNMFHHIRVIYCTPRSMNEEQMEAGLNECIRFKERWPEMIAGFDVVGEEGPVNHVEHPLKKFTLQFLVFRETCKRKDLDIPFLFHCGETLDMGTSTDGNLIDALLLGAKRIGHGFALPKHPYIMQLMKEAGVCVEVCPISNEILGLTPRAASHAMYALLANNVHCTVNSDNGTLFR
ncbi:hypothetical protein ED733_005931 [Metarhizium rileyi]|uniref:Adenosine deaminase domain-containing protein n=1 Tax=Metarhizium rileyi (strain RCEF 4871) TaxID=1649241 RepID=A0A5C6GDT0_METRR|nr:hypothetical protein ED733_005931 [Metarhizium rileyi]